MLKRFKLLLGTLSNVGKLFSDFKETKKSVVAMLILKVIQYLLLIKKAKKFSLLKEFLEIKLNYVTRTAKV